MQTLNVTDRSLILNFNKEKRNLGEIKPTFKPELNKKSQQILNSKNYGQASMTNTVTFGKRNNQNGASKNQPMGFYERQLQHQQKKELKIKEQQNIKE